MRLVILPLVLAAACNPVGVLAWPPSDTAQPEGDTDTDTDADTDTDTDADTDADTDVLPEPDYTVWDGMRNFFYESDWSSCDDDVYETGSAIQAGDPDFDELQGMCPSCDWFYLVNVSPDQVCDWIDIATETYRGLDLGSTSATVYRLDYERPEELAEGSFDGWTIEYSYESSTSIQVTGQVVFPPTE